MSQTMAAEKVAPGLGRLASGLGPLHWAFLAWIVAAAALLAADAARLQQFFPDTDDAARLVQVRAFLESGSWFDTTLAQFGFAGYVSHWSRLIDLPLAALISLFALVMPVATAELVVQAIWPLILLLPLFLLLASVTDQLAGRTAAAFALVLAATAFTGLLQFRPGRIDHHNAMILATVGSVFLMAGMRSATWTPSLAGALAALSLTIGYEALPIVAIASAALVVWALINPVRSQAVTRYCIAFAATLALLLFATVAPSQWFVSHCDALSMNIVALATLSAAGAVVTLQRAHDEPLWVRLLPLSAGGIAGLALYAAIEPVCLAGPFAEVPKAVYPIWLDAVGEARPLWWHFARMPGLAASVAAVLLAGAIAYAMLVRRAQDDRLIYLAAVSTLVSIFAIWQFKFVSYATWLLIPALAILVTRIEGTPQISRRAMQLLVLFCISPATLHVAGAWIAKAATKPAVTSEQYAEAALCRSKDRVAALAALAPGLIVSHIDLGPAIAAATHHRVLTGPYHRMPEELIAAYAAFAAAPADGVQKLKSLGASYVVDCPFKQMPAVATKPGSDTLLAILREGRPIEGLTGVTPTAAAPLRVWRVNP